MAEIVVHHLEKSRSTRILWVLEELGVEYTIQRYSRDRNFRGPPELRELHPLGKSPIVTIDGDVLAESGAIIEELVERFGSGSLRPAEGTPERRRYRYWLHYAEGSLMSPLLVKLITSRLKRAKAPFFVKPIAKGIAEKIDGTFTDAELTRHFGFMESHLGEHDYFAGDAFTAADIQLSYPIEAGAERAGLSDASPNVMAWLKRVQARDAYARAVEAGGPMA